MVRVPLAPPIITFPHQKVETFFEFAITHTPQGGRSEPWPRAFPQEVVSYNENSLWAYDESSLDGYLGFNISGGFRPSNGKVGSLNPWFSRRCVPYISNKLEKPIDSVYDGIFDRGLAPRDYQSGYFISQRDDHLDEKLPALLRKHPEGLTRWQLSARFQIPVREINWYLDSMIKKGEVVEVKRENTRGRPLSPLLFTTGAEKPEGNMVRTERDERIRQAYFVEGKSIKQIAREFHNNRHIVRRAIRSGKRE